MEIIAYLIGGALSGLLAGLLGIGGGLVVIPFLVFALPYIGFPSDIIMHVAVTTSLANIVITSLVSVYAHHKHSGVKWEIFRKVFFACALGAIVGALLATNSPGKILSVIFSIFVFFIAFNLLRAKSIKAHERSLPSGIKLNSSVFGIAAFCSLLGMGGGSLMVPFYSYYNVPLRFAVGTSAANGLIIACFGLLAALLFQLHVISPRAWMTGYLYWPAFGAMSLASICFAPIGAKLAHTLPVTLLKRIFAGFLIIVGISMIYNLS